MSQQKVDLHKSIKSNRKKINRRKKITNAAISISTGLACIAIVFWIGFSLYTKTQNPDSETSAKIPVNLTAISDYLDNLSKE